VHRSPWSGVGSTNLDWRGFVGNDKVNAVVLGPDFVRLMVDMIARDLAASETIALEDWEKRLLLLRLKHWAAHLLHKSL